MDRFPIGDGRWLWAISPDEIRPPDPIPIIPVDIDTRRLWYIDAKGMPREVDPRIGIPKDARKWTFEGDGRWFPFHGEQPDSARRSTATNPKRSHAS